MLQHHPFSPRNRPPQPERAVEEAPHQRATVGGDQMEAEVVGAEERNCWLPPY